MNYELETVESFLERYYRVQIVRSKDYLSKNSQFSSRKMPKKIMELIAINKARLAGEAKYAILSGSEKDKNDLIRKIKKLNDKAFKAYQKMKAANG